MALKRFRETVFVILFFVCAGLIGGCGSGGDEIPLAKVPPPPEGFLTGRSKAKIPNGASPVNATELRR
jgi:hypothetical protein